MFCFVFAFVNITETVIQYIQETAMFAEGHGFDSDNATFPIFSVGVFAIDDLCCLSLVVILLVGLLFLLSFSFFFDVKS